MAMDMEFMMDIVNKVGGGSRVVLGNAQDLIPKYLEPNSVHAVITDPPY